MFVCAISVSRRLIVVRQVVPRRLTTLLLVQQTALAEHALPVPTPMTVTGEQSSPMSPVISPRTIPRRPRRIEAVAEFD